MTITIYSDEPSTIDRVLQLLHREKVAFDVKKTKEDVLDDLKDAVAEVRRKDLTGEQLRPTCRFDCTSCCSNP